MDNKIVIGTSFDTSKFDQQISELQRKIKNLRETGPGGSFSQLAQQYRSQGEDQKAQRIEEFRQRNDKQNRISIQADLNKQKQMLDNMFATESKLNNEIEKRRKLGQDYISILNQQERVTQAILSKQQQIAQAQASIAKAGGLGGGGPQGPGSNIPLGPVGGGTPGGILGMLTNPKILGMMGSALGFAGQAYKQIGTYPERLTQREAQIASMTSETSRLQAQGKGYEMALFAPERARALEKATNRVGYEKAWDLTKLGGITLAGAGLGAKLAAPFATAFSGLPPVAAGIEVGGTLLGAGTAFGGAMLNDRMRSMVFDRDAYKKEMGAVFSNTYQDQFAAERAKSYQKDLAAQFFEGQSDRFRRLQRKFGLSDEELFQGDRSLFSRAASKEGGRYGIEDIDRAMMGISAAGGPTKVAVGGAIEAAKLQRNLGVTNAPELMGRISGVTGMDEIRSKDEVIRMFAEGTRIGLDASEVKDFMQAATETAYKTGGNLESLTGLLSAGVEGSGLKTTRGIEASQNAMERLRQETGQRSGLTGQYKMAAMSSMGISDLGEMAYLSDLSIDQIKSDPRAMRMLKERGIDPDNFIKEMSRATTKRDKTVQGAEGWTTAKKKLEGLRPGTKEYEQAKKDEEKAGDIFAQSLSIEESLPKSGPERQAYIEMKRASLSGDTAGYEKAQKAYEEAKKKAETEAPGAVAKADRSKASDQEAMLLNLTNNIKALNTAFDENTGLTAQAKAAAQGLEHLAKILENIKDPDIKEKVQKALEEVNSAGKEKGKPDSDKEVKTGNQGPAWGF